MNKTDVQESRVQIVATIGPVSGTTEVLRMLVSSRMNVVRLNFSWGTYEEHALYIANTRAVARELGVSLPIIQDLSGPRTATADGHGFDEQAEQSSGGILTEKDIRDIDFGVTHRVDYVCLSYVGTAEDVRQARSTLATHGSNARVIAKIERAIAVENAETIMDVCDAIMIGRGDLGRDVPIERIPFIQRDLILKAKKRKLPIITATQMLLSMVESPTPSRAEVTDVAYAVLCGSDAVMFSEETARGKYPIEAVASMERIIVEAEKHLPKPTVHILKTLG